MKRACSAFLQRLFSHRAAHRHRASSWMIHGECFSARCAHASAWCAFARESAHNILPLCAHSARLRVLSVLFAASPLYKKKHLGLRV